MVDDQPPRATLATPEQLLAERTVAKAIADPRVETAIEEIKDSLESDPAAERPEGKATMDYSVRAWTASLAYREYNDPRRPAFLIVSEETPRTWYGQDAPSAGISGDNPDFAYRIAELNGDYTYEVRGRMPANPPTQVSLVLARNTPNFRSSKKSPDLGNFLCSLIDRNLETDDDGNFVVTLDLEPANGRPNHMQLAPGPMRLLLRCVLADWSLPPVPATITRTDGGEVPPPMDADELAGIVVHKLPEFVDFWTRFKEGWLLRPTPNTMKVVPRDGDWGYLAGSEFDLAEGEGLLVTLRDGGSQYMGVEACNRWFLVPDSRRVFTSLNNTQAERNADGSITYVLAPHDPGFVNWISSDGLHNGFIMARWHQCPTDIDTSALVQDVRLVKLARLRDAIPNGTWLTTEGRAEALRRREESYGLRFKSRI